MWVKGYWAEVLRFKIPANVGSFRERCQDVTNGKALMTKCAMNVIGYACGHYSARGAGGRKGSFITR
jgi:hypothetical protein